MPERRRRWTWGFPGRTKERLTCSNHPIVRYLQRVLRVPVPDDYKVPHCLYTSIFWMVRQELAHSQELSVEQVALIDSKVERVNAQGYFMSPTGVVTIFRRAEISTVYQLKLGKQLAIRRLPFSGPTHFSLDPEPGYLQPSPIELLLVPETITKAWWNGIQAWIRYQTKRTLVYEFGIRIHDQKIIDDDHPDELIKLPSPASQAPDREVIQSWMQHLTNPPQKEPVFAILRSRNLLCHLLLQLASPDAMFAPWSEHFVPGLVYGIDRNLPAPDQIQFFPLCI